MINHRHFMKDFMKKIGLESALIGIFSEAVNLVLFKNVNIYRFLITIIIAFVIKSFYEKAKD